jgi:hypothetical protein
MDAGIMNMDKFPASFYEEVYEALPSLQLHENFAALLGNGLKRKPHTAYLAFEADILRRTSATGCSS